MNLQKAIKMLTEEYERAQKMCFVRNPLAWALYRVWKKADGQKDWDEDCIRDCKNCWKTKLANPQWIPVTERLPGFEIERVLVMIKGDFILGYPKMDTDRYVNSIWVRYGDNVTHWMPLPEPPKEVSM